MILWAYYALLNLEWLSSCTGAFFPPCVAVWLVCFIVYYRMKQRLCSSFMEVYGFIGSRKKTSKRKHIYVSVVLWEKEIVAAVRPDKTCENNVFSSLDLLKH